MVDANENIWLWGVTEGTDLGSAFRYGDGEESFPLLVSDNYRDIPEEMWRQEGYTSLAAIVSDCENWWSDEIAKHLLLLSMAWSVFAFKLVKVAQKKRQYLPALYNLLKSSTSSRLKGDTGKPS